jgi:hypothetical protein
MGYMRKKMVLKYRSGKAEFVDFVPRSASYLSITTYGKLFLEKLLVPKQIKTFIALNGIRRRIITDR